MKLTKNFRIKTQEGFTDVINFLSESVYFREEKDADGKPLNLDKKIIKEVKALEQADATGKCCKGSKVYEEGSSSCC